MEVDSYPTPAGYVAGSARYQIYQNLPGLGLDDLTLAAKFPNQADLNLSIDSLEGTHRGDNYGSRISGYIIPRVSGDYTFYIASDDASAFYFGISEATKSQLCEVTTYTAPNDWTATPAQQSSVQSLTKDTPYYFEILHKEGGGADHLAVAWEGPGIDTPTVIDGAFLALEEGMGNSIVTQPADQERLAGESLTLNVGVSGDGPFLYQWFLDGQSYWTPSSSPQLTLENIGAGAVGDYHCEITTPSGLLVSESAHLSISDLGTLTEGGLWRELYNNIGGVAISDLRNESRFPRFPDSGSAIMGSEGPSEAGSNFGERWTGWLKPDVTGVYSFHLASDNASELWLSTDDQPGNKVKIAELNGYTAPKAWSSGASSQGIELIAGNRYYVELLHKESGGADHCAFTWQKPGEAALASPREPREADKSTRTVA